MGTAHQHHSQEGGAGRKSRATATDDSSFHSSNYRERISSASEGQASLQPCLALKRRCFGQGRTRRHGPPFRRGWQNSGWKCCSRCFLRASATTSSWDRKVRRRASPATCPALPLLQQNMEAEGSATPSCPLQRKAA